MVGHSGLYTKECCSVGTDVAIKIVTIPEGDVKREAMKEVK